MNPIKFIPVDKELDLSLTNESDLLEKKLQITWGKKAVTYIILLLFPLTICILLITLSTVVIKNLLVRPKKTFNSLYYYMWQYLLVADYNTKYATIVQDYLKKLSNQVPVKEGTEDKPTSYLH